MKVDALIERYIERDPHQSGPENARLKEEGIAVWALIANLRGTEGDPARTAEEFGVSPEAVEAAVAFYRRHKERIDAKILLTVA